MQIATINWTDDWPHAQLANSAYAFVMAAR